MIGSPATREDLGRPAAPPSTRRRTLVWSFGRKYGSAVALILILLALWQAAIHLFNVPDYLLPAPTEIVSALGTDRYFGATWVTLQEIIFGFAIALVAGPVIAVALHASLLLRRAIYRPHRLADRPDHRHRADPRSGPWLRHPSPAHHRRADLLLPIVVNTPTAWDR